MKKVLKKLIDDFNFSQAFGSASNLAVKLTCGAHYEYESHIYSLERDGKFLHVKTKLYSILIYNPESSVILTSFPDE